MATSDDSPRLQELFKLNDLWIEGLDWSELQGWYVAVRAGEIIGAIQVLLGKPLGVILYVMVDPQFHGTGLGPRLITFAEMVLRINGCDGWAGVTNRPDVASMGKRYGATELYDVTMFAKRIWRYKSNENLQQNCS